ncbi:MAG: hypothetical protein JNL18_15705 [Planctomycetaceae bacterium]|nr:hypothetical protein [Planctomycetaceae bacterium]
MLLLAVLGAWGVDRKRLIREHEQSIHELAEIVHLNANTAAEALEKQEALEKELLQLKANVGKNP